MDADVDLEFEFDEVKSRSNAEKHGIDFEKAQRLWADDDAIVVPARDAGEHRHLVVGLVGAVHWSAVITYRGERIRIISVRRSRAEEVRLYEGE